MCLLKPNLSLIHLDFGRLWDSFVCEVTNLNVKGVILLRKSFFALSLRSFVLLIFLRLSPLVLQTEIVLRFYLRLKSLAIRSIRGLIQRVEVNFHIDASASPLRRLPLFVLMCRVNFSCLNS